MKIFLIFISLVTSNGDFKKLGEQVEVESLEKDLVFFPLGKNLKMFDELSKIISQQQIYSIPFQNPIAIPQWKRFPGNFIKIALGADDIQFGINSSYEIYHFQNHKWERFPGRAKNLCSASLENIWAISQSGHIFHLDYEKREWKPIKGRAQDLACGYDGTVMAVYPDEEAERSQLPYGSLVMWKKQGWVNFPGQLERLAVADKNDIWGVKKNGGVWHFNGKRWLKMPGEMSSISISKDKIVLGTGRNGGAYIWNGNEWINVPGISLMDFVGLKNGHYFALTDDGSLWISK